MSPCLNALPSRYAKLARDQSVTIRSEESVNIKTSGCFLHQKQQRDCSACILLEQTAARGKF
jgi:hypothetical protein